jgi:hypothetical protein
MNSLPQLEFEHGIGSLITSLSWLRMRILPKLWLSGNMGVGELKPVETDYLQRWAVSKRVNSSKADSNDPTLIDAVKQAA